MSQVNPVLSEPPSIRRAVVVIPTYDERENVADIIGAVMDQQEHAADFELHALVADSHSQDGTLAIVQGLADGNPRVHLLDVGERGIGIGLYKGFCHAVEALGADVLLEMDADFQHNPADIPHFLEKIGEGYDLVVGSRFVRGSVNRMPWYRRILSLGANQVIRSMVGLSGVTEITTSYRAFSRELFEKIDPEVIPWREKSFIFVPVLLVRMMECGAHPVEIPMTMHARAAGYSKMDYAAYIRDILWFSIRSRFAGRPSAGSRN